MIIDLFHQIVYEFKRHIVIADYTGNFPQYDVYDSAGRWIGCTNVSTKLGMQGNCRQIINHTPF